MPDRALRPLVILSEIVETTSRRRENKNARQGIATLLQPDEARPAVGEKTKMPDRALRPARSGNKISMLIVEKTKMPDRALRQAVVRDIPQHPFNHCGENKNARQGIATAPHWQRFIVHPLVEKTKMPDRALRQSLNYRLGHSPTVEKTKMPDRALRLEWVFLSLQHDSVEKTKMPDRALRPWRIKHTSHFQLRGGENKNARQGIAT